MNTKSQEIRKPNAEELKKFKEKFDGEEIEKSLVGVIQLSDKLLGYFNNGALIGVIVYTRNLIQGYTKIDTIAVETEFQRSGIAKTLVQHIEKLFGRKTYLNPFTDSSETAFAKMGFKINSTFDPDDSNTMIL